MTTPAEDTLTALIHLLDREGYDAVTADQLARQAGMSRASFFRHLGGKEEVVFADHAALLARLDDFLRGTSLGVREALEEAVLQVFRHHTADPDRARARSRLLRGSQSLRTRELLTSHRYTELFYGWLATALPDTPPRGGVAVGLAAAVVAVHNR
ncbi:helix-turn-helix transcriptional regulator, partial [Escherichia coli]|nr:helix-turn-helix transcriptional regulator [Escherichia coli]